MIITTMAGKMLGEGNINAGIYYVALGSFSTNSKFNGMMYFKMFNLINISNLVLSHIFKMANWSYHLEQQKLKACDYNVS